jgi:hypothetical protein
MKNIFSFYYPPTKESCFSPVEISYIKGKKFSLPKYKYLGFRLPPKIDNKYLKSVGEDSMSVKKGKNMLIFTLADGVTWRGKGGENFPVPSPAKKVADIFTSLIFKVPILEDPEYFLRFYFSLANKKIFEFNLKRLKNKKINWWNIDYAHICALLALVKENKLFYGVIGDSGLFIFDKNGNIKHQSKPIDWFHKNYPFKEFIEKLKFLIQKESENYYDGERLTRKYFRNKLDNNYIPYGYGVLTGEKEALFYVIYENVGLENGDVILFFTDGFEPFLNEPEFKKILMSKNKKLIGNFIKEKREKDLIKFGHEFSLYIYYHS